MKQPNDSSELGWRLVRQGKERRKSLRIQNILKWALAFLLAISGYFVKDWITKVDTRLGIVEYSYTQDHTELKVLIEQTRSIDERVSDVDTKIDLTLDKLDKIKEQTK